MSKEMILRAICLIINEEKTLDGLNFYRFFFEIHQPKFNEHFVETDGIMALACNSSTWSN